MQIEKVDCSLLRIVEESGDELSLSYGVLVGHSRVGLVHSFQSAA
jgi:hypothetical protein